VEILAKAFKNKNSIHINQNIGKIFNQSLFQLLGKGATAFSTLAVIAIINNFYKSEGVGIYTLALTYLGFFYLATDLGLNAYVLPKLSTSPSEADKLFTIRVVISVLLVFVSCLLAFIIPIKNDLFVQAVILGSISIVFNGIFNSANMIYQKKLRYDLSVLGSTFGALVTLSSVYYLSIIGATIPYLILAPTLGWLVNNLIAGFLVQNLHKFKFVKIETLYIKNMIFDAWPIALTLLLNVFYFKIDSFILGSFFPISIVGNYNLAYQFFQTALVLPTFIMNSYYPLMLRQLSQDRLAFFNQIKLGSFALLGISLLGTLATILLSPYLIEILSGDRSSTVTLQLLSIGFPAFFVSALLMWGLISLKRYRAVLAVYATGLVLNFLLNLIFIPRYSYLAASGVTVFCEYLILFLLVFILYRESKITKA
jgi:O-antigen/teichoic acid export membrane protein